MYTDANQRPIYKTENHKTDNCDLKYFFSKQYEHIHLCILLTNIYGAPTTCQTQGRQAAESKTHQVVSAFHTIL